MAEEKAARDVEKPQGDRIKMARRGKSAAQRRHQAKFRKAAKKCRHSGKSYRACMKTELRK